MYFYIFESKDMLSTCLNFKKYQSIRAYKHYAYKQKSVERDSL